MKKILVVDDHPILREGIVHVLEAENNITVCGQAGSAEEALRLVEQTSPDLVLTDLSLPGKSGLELVKELAATHPKLPILVMSMHDELIYAERVLKAGGRGYIMKEAAPDRLIEAVHTVLAGNVHASQQVTNHFLESMTAGNGKKFSFPLDRLTDRELEVFELIGRGKNNKEIASHLSISQRTVDAHRQNLREKFGAGSGGDITLYAVRWIESQKLGSTGD